MPCRAWRVLFPPPQAVSDSHPEFLPPLVPWPSPPQGFTTPDDSFAALSLGGQPRAAQPQHAQPHAAAVPHQQPAAAHQAPRRAPEPLKQAPGPRDDAHVFRRDVPVPRELQRARAQARPRPNSPSPSSLLTPPSLPPIPIPHHAPHPPPQAAASAVMEKVRVSQIALRDGAFVVEAADADALESAVLLLEVDVQHQARADTGGYGR